MMAWLVYSKNVPDGIEKEEFDAALCDEPIPGEKYELPEDCDHATDVKKEIPEEEDMTILEERKYEDIPIDGCKLLISEMISECWPGTFNTEQFVSRIQVQKPFHVSKDECRRMIETRTFKDKRGTVHPLDGPHGVTDFQVVSVGDIQVREHETYCTGAQTYVKGELRDNILTLEYYNVYITKAVARFDREEPEAEVLDNGEKFSCKKEEEGCVVYSNDVTYIWKNNGEICPLVVVNRLLGHRENGHFISKDAGVYLKMNTPEVVPNCNFQVYKTDIENYYLMESSKAEKHGHELKDFNPDDFNELDWSWARDKYSRHEQGIKRREENRAQSMAFCKHMQNQHVRGLSLSEKGSSNIMPWKGVGSYLMVEGEQLGSFTCPVVPAVPRKSTLCTYELPVSYKGQDYYLQPISRILTKSYTLAICSEAGGAVYKSNGGRFLRANPSLSYVGTPKKRKSFFEEEKDEVEEEEDTIKYGLFSAEDTRQYAHSIHFKSRKHELQTKMATHWCTKNSAEGCGFDDGTIEYSPIEITDAVEDTVWETVLRGVLNFGGIGKTLAELNWFYELLMKVVFGITLFYNIILCCINCRNKWRSRSDNMHQNIIIDVEDGLRAGAPPAEESPTSLWHVG